MRHKEGNLWSTVRNAFTAAAHGAFSVSPSVDPALPLLSASSHNVRKRMGPQNSRP